VANLAPSADEIFGARTKPVAASTDVDRMLAIARDALTLVDDELVRDLILALAVALADLADELQAVRAAYHTALAATHATRAQAARQRDTLRRLRGREAV
jgi:hypothetical protein